jgi:hypothetical protein
MTRRGAEGVGLIACNCTSPAPERPSYHADRLVVTPEERHRVCWYSRRTVAVPVDVGLHTIIDGQLVYCAHPMLWPIVGYEFDISNCADCDYFRPARAVPARQP